MPIGSISDGESGADVRVKLNSAIAGVNNIGLQFTATIAAAPANVTGDGTAYTIPYDTVGSSQSFVSLNTSTGVATINTTGTYLVECSVRTFGSGDGDTWQGTILVNGSSRRTDYREATNEARHVPKVTTVIQLTATNTVAFQLTVGGGTKNYDIGNNTDQTYFSITRLA